MVLPLRGSPMSPIFTEQSLCHRPLRLDLWLLTRSRPGALAAFFLTQPAFGVAIAHLVTGIPAPWIRLVASLAVAVGFGLTTR